MNIQVGKRADFFPQKTALPAPTEREAIRNDLITHRSSICSIYLIPKLQYIVSINFS
nr:MAG TPA: hypothetical protein [Caudoviricetes sp.]